MKPDWFTHRRYNIFLNWSKCYALARMLHATCSSSQPAMNKHTYHLTCIFSLSLSSFLTLFDAYFLLAYFHLFWRDEAKNKTLFIGFYRPQFFSLFIYNQRRHTVCVNVKLNRFRPIDMFQRVSSDWLAFFSLWCTKKERYMPQE